MLSACQFLHYCFLLVFVNISVSINIIRPDDIYNFVCNYQTILFIYLINSLIFSQTLTSLMLLVGCSKVMWPVKSCCGRLQKFVLVNLAECRVTPFDQKRREVRQADKCQTFCQKLSARPKLPKVQV